MRVYKASFYGRTKGAIGIYYRIHTEVNGENEEAARLNLYERFEHISHLTLEPALSYSARQAQANGDVSLDD